MPGEIYKIGEAAQLLGLKSYVLRFWESEFPQLNPTRTESGQRLYSERDLELLRRIRNLLHERGLTIGGARKILNELQYADEGLSSDLLDKGYQEFFMAMEPEDYDAGSQNAAVRLAARQTPQRAASHIAVPTGTPGPGLGAPKLEPEAAKKIMAGLKAENAALRSAFGYTLDELKELRSLIAAPDSKENSTSKV